MKHRRLLINLVLLAVAMLGQVAVATATRNRTHQVVLRAFTRVMDLER